MGHSGGTKGLKIRLGAADVAGLVDELRPRLSSGLLFVATGQRPPLGATLRLLFLYSDGSKAMETSGEVRGVCGEGEEAGLELDVQWPGPLIEELRARPSTAHLIADLDLPSEPSSPPVGAVSAVSAAPGAGAICEDPELGPALAATLPDRTAFGPDEELARSLEDEARILPNPPWADAETIAEPVPLVHRKSSSPEWEGQLKTDADPAPVELSARSAPPTAPQSWPPTPAAAPREGADPGLHENITEPAVPDQAAAPPAARRRRPSQTDDPPRHGGERHRRPRAAPRRSSSAPELDPPQPRTWQRAASEFPDRLRSTPTPAPRPSISELPIEAPPLAVSERRRGGRVEPISQLGVPALDGPPRGAPGLSARLVTGRPLSTAGSTPADAAAHARPVREAAWNETTSSRPPPEARARAVDRAPAGSSLGGGFSDAPAEREVAAPSLASGGSSSGGGFSDAPAARGGAAPSLASGGPGPGGALSNAVEERVPTVPGRPPVDGPGGGALPPRASSELPIESPRSDRGPPPLPPRAAPPDDTEAPPSSVSYPEVSDDIPLLPPEELDVLVQAPPLVAPTPERVSSLRQLSLQDSAAPSRPANSVEPRARLTKAGGQGAGEVTPLARIALVRNPAAAAAPAVIEERGVTGGDHEQARVRTHHKEQRMVGLDLGSGTSEVAIIQAGRPRRLEGRDGRRALPTAVYLQPSGRTFVGEPALRQVDADPAHGMRGFLRLLGRPAASRTARQLTKRRQGRMERAPNDELAMRFGALPITVRGMTTALFKELRAGAEHSLGAEVSRVVVVCPAHFGVRQRAAVVGAAEAAGLTVERLVSEGLAAAVAFGRDHPEAHRLLCLDFGAGSLDVSVVERDGEGWRALGARGDPSLGGTELDAKLCAHLMALSAERGVQLSLNTGDLREVAEMGKWALSEQENTQIQLDPLGVAVALDLPRQKLELLLGPSLKSGLSMSDALMSSLELSDQDLDAVLPLGGQCAAPMVRSKLQQRYGGLFAASPMAHMVSSGAAWVAQQMEAGEAPDLQDVLPKTLGVVAEGGQVQPVFAAGTGFPAEAEVVHRVVREGQAEVYLYEGSRGHVDLDDPVYRYSLTLPAGLGLPLKVALKLKLDRNGLLSLTATAASGGIHVDAVLQDKLQTKSIQDAYRVKPWRSNSRRRLAPPRRRSLCGLASGIANVVAVQAAQVAWRVKPWRGSRRRRVPHPGGRAGITSTGNAMWAAGRLARRALARQPPAPRPPARRGGGMQLGLRC